MSPERPHWRFWPAGVPRTAPTLDDTLPMRLAAAAALHPGKPAIVFAGTTMSYAVLQARVAALAGYLQQELGVASGDRVLLVSQNCPQWVVACQAVWRAGAVVVPVSPMCKAGEIAYHAADSGARVALAAQEMLPQLRLGAAAGEFDAVVVHAYAEALGDPAAADGDDALPPGMQTPLRPLDDTRLHGFEAAVAAGRPVGPMPVDPSALVLLAYTSGTTGQPKGCRHTHGTLLASLATSAVWKRLHAGSVVLAVAPLFHMLGLQNGMNLPLFLGASAVMMPRWQPATAARLIERHRVSAWSAPPAMVMDLLADPGTAGRDLSSLALLSGGGAAMPEAVSTLLLQRYGLNYEEAYGLTETASFLHANPPARCKRQCLGMPTQGVDSRIVDPVTLAELPPGEVGELITHAPQVTPGYWRRPDADREAFVEFEGRRFFRTGDLAVMDEDGYFFLKDRLKRMINVSGYKVWPAEVENALYAHPAVQEACVIAVPDPREGREGDSVKALVVLKAGCAGTLTAEAFIGWCREQMAVYKAPRSVEFVEALPRSGTGKIMWRALQEAHATREARP